jgi:PAS domain S-box-containing protein
MGMPNEKILVIDDNVHIRNACTEFLQSVGYNVSSVENGEQGIKLLQKTSFELVITDFKMPGIDGLGVLRHVKEQYPKTDVIIITAYGTIENAVEAMRLGAYDYITKNFDIAELELVVKRCLEKQRLSAQVKELKELVNLYEMSKAMSSLMGLEELLNLILRLVCDTLAADGGSIMLYDPDANELVVRVASGDRKDMIVGERVQLGKRVAGFSAEQEEMLAIQGNLNDDPRFSNLMEFDTFKSSMIAPLQRKGKLLGVISVHRKKNDVKFNDRDMKLLSIFAVEAAIAIENAHLFNSLEEEKEGLDAIFTNMGDGAISTDAEFNITKCNKTAEELLGIPQSEIVGKNFSSLLEKFESSVSWKELINQSKRAVSFELSRKEGKNLYLGILDTKIFDQSNALIGHVIVLRNVTEAEDGFSCYYDA